MKWWILDDALRDERGHYFEYVRTFKRELGELGDETMVFADRTAEPWLLEALDASPRLPRSIWARMSDGASPLTRLLRYPSHGLQTYRAVGSLFKTESPPDLVFFPSVFTHHLLGLVPFLRIHARRMRTKFLLFFPNTPIRYSAETGGVAPNPDPMARAFPRLLRALGTLVRERKVVLAAESNAMKEALQQIGGVPFIYLPHPVSSPALTSDRPPQDGETPTLDGKERILLGCYGPARHEKGSDLLQRAVASYLENTLDSRAHFSIQWINDFEDVRGKVVEKSPDLLKHPNVTYITGHFPPGESYLRQVARTDVMVLPYRESYRFRISRVVIEAMQMGVPVIASRGTTLCQQAEEFGAVVPCDQDSVESLREAIRYAIDNIADLKTRAQVRAPAAREHFSVRVFRERVRQALS